MKRLFALLLSLVLVAALLPTAAVALTHDHNDGTWIDLNAVLDSKAGGVMLDGGNYYLSADLPFSKQKILRFSGDTVLCLNGHTLRVDNTAGDALWVYDGDSSTVENLTVCDYVGGGAFIVSSIATADNTRAQGLWVNGNLTLDNVTAVFLADGNATTYAYALYLDGNLTVNGGSLFCNASAQQEALGYCVMGTVSMTDADVTLQGICAYSGAATDADGNEIWGYGDGGYNRGLLYLDGCTVTASGSVSGFTHSSADALWCTGPYASIQNSSVTANAYNSNSAAKGSYLIALRASAHIENSNVTAACHGQTERAYAIYHSGESITGISYDDCTLMTPSGGYVYETIASGNDKTHIAYLMTSYEQVATSAEILAHGTHAAADGWVALSDALTDATPTDGVVQLSGGRYFISADLTTEYSITFSTDTLLCLNGHTLTVSCDTDFALRVLENAETHDSMYLHVCDCTGAGTLSCPFPDNSADASRVGLAASGSVVLEHCTVDVSGYASTGILSFNGAVCCNDCDVTIATEAHDVSNPIMAGSDFSAVNSTIQADAVLTEPDPAYADTMACGICAMNNFFVRSSKIDVTVRAKATCALTATGISQPQSGGYQTLLQDSTITADVAFTNESVVEQTAAYALSLIPWVYNSTITLDTANAADNRALGFSCSNESYTAPTLGTRIQILEPAFGTFAKQSTDTTTALTILDTDSNIASHAVIGIDTITKLGDADCDGSVSAADAARLMRFIVNLGALTQQGKRNANVDGGALTSSDAAIILRMTVGLS